MSASGTSPDAIPSPETESSAPGRKLQILAFPEFGWLPAELVMFYKDGDNMLRPLYEKHTWLKELDSNRANLSKLRKEFFDDSYTFMAVLVQFLHVQKWKEFILETCIYNPRCGPVLFELLKFTFRDESYKPTIVASSPNTASSMNREVRVLGTVKVTEADRKESEDFVKALESRYHEREISHSDIYVPWFSRRGLIERIQKELELDYSESKNKLEAIEWWIKEIDSITADTMLFGYKVQEPELDFLEDSIPDEPEVLLKSAHWKRIGRNLCSLGLLVGADVPRWPEEEKQFSVVTALQRAAKNDGVAINVMLARLEEQNSTIQKQQQAITALEFRHILEMMPGRGKAPSPGQATNEWKDFWRKAVTAAYTEYVSLPPSRSPKSPLAAVLNNKFDQARKRKNGLTWLLEQTEINQRALILYNTLSQVIHDYQSTEFSINPLVYSTGDVQLLKMITPDPGNIVDGAVNWAAEYDRYIP
ncbi:hypothetical protein F4779DRAFT_617979 [Xylariaceae sp. FL0662B]|nr:hypothetical protein F4779DRAFT_617979 [Xylariaceae sp. FL0662B]